MAEEICSAFVWKNSFLCISVQSHLHRMFWNKSYTIQPDLQSESSKIKSIFQHKSVNHTMHLILFSWLIKCMNFHTAMLGRMGIIFSQLFQKVHAFLMEMCNITLPVVFWIHILHRIHQCPLLLSTFQLYFITVNKDLVNKINCSLPGSIFLKPVRRILP